MPLSEVLERWAQPRSVHATVAASVAELIPLNAPAEKAVADADPSV